MQIETSPTSYGCIYKITNKLNNKCNIGQTTDINNRFKKYKSLQCKRQPKLYNALKKYGWDNFNKEIIAEATTKCQLDELEIYYIKFYDSINNGYNCSPGGSFGKHSLESKAKMSLCRKGIPKSEESKIKQSKSTKGRCHSEEFKRILSEAAKGKHPTAETRRKMSESQKGEKSHMYGKVLSEETKRKMSESHKKATRILHAPLFF